jgi:peptide deformylase
MPARPILQLGDPALHERAEPVEDLDGARRVIDDLRDTLAAFRQRAGFGRAISAPQIGVATRIVWVRLQPTGFRGALLDPSIIDASSQRFEVWDDCFSFPELMVKVSRHVRVRVAYRDEWGEPAVLDAEGAFSELLQHELDHLDGVLATGRAIGPTAFCTREEWQRRYAF